jgi:branched-chain amino acid transport system substrate-binding protein
MFIQRMLIVWLVAILGAVSVSCDKSGDKKMTDMTGARERVKVGVLYIGTGENAAYGTYTHQGLDLALAEIASPSVEFIYKDTKADPQEAIRVYKELRAAGVPVVLGPFTSTEVRQVGPEAQRDQTVLITTSATADDLSKIGDHVFMMLPPNSQQGSDQAKFAITKLAVKRAAILYRQNPYGQTLREGFMKQFIADGGQVVADIGFPDGTEDFADRLRTIMATGPQVVFFPVHDTDAGRILRQAREINMPTDVKFLGCDGSMSETTIKLAATAAEGAIFSNVASVSGEFNKTYAAKYGGVANPYAAAAHDAAMIVDKLAADGARTSDQFEVGMTGLSDFTGATGKTNFKQVDQSYWALGKVYRQFIVHDGEFELLP